MWNLYGLIALGLFLAAAIGAFALGSEELALMLGGAAVGGAVVPRVREPLRTGNTVPPKATP